MKILTVQTGANSVDEIEKLLTEGGIKKERLSGAFGTTFLPKTGKFETFGIDGEVTTDENDKEKVISDTRHVRIGTKDMLDSISLSRLQANIFVGQPTKEMLKESAKHNFFLQGNTIVNPSLQGNQASAIKKMLGKYFVARPVYGQTLAFVDGGLKDRDLAEFKPIVAFKVELFDTKEQADTRNAELSEE